jgi:4-amino-4-deoxy-L-arabinose transferase-like glycosyltransferase
MNVFWDEMPHLNGGLLLSQGHLQQYLTATRYPPMLDLLIAASFKIFGSSVFAGRLVSVVFAVLTLGVFYLLVSKAYGRKVGLLASLFFASMPAYVYLARVSFLEMILEFFFIATLWLFYSWLNSGKNLTIILAGVMLGLGFLAKYQVIVAALVMVVALPLLLYKSGKFKVKPQRFLLLLAAAAAIIIPFFLQIYYSGVLKDWLGLLVQSDTHANVYGARFPLPIFYLLEMTYPIPAVHPVSILVLALGLFGLGFFVWRRKPEDKLFLVWFIVVYVFFTLIGTKSWRYVMPLYPVLAISAAAVTYHMYGALQSRLKVANLTLSKTTKIKLAAAFLIVFTAGAIAYSTYDAATWVSAYAVYVPIPEAVKYISKDLASNQSVMVVCAMNVINDQMVKFYMNAYQAKTNPVLQYPALPVDDYVPQFNTSELVAICQQNNVRYLMVYEYKGLPYFNTPLNAGYTSSYIMETGYFNYTAQIGTSPNRIFIFTANQTLLNP